MSNGNYSGFLGKISLSINHFDRAMGDLDIQFLLDEYKKLQNGYSKLFDKIYVITSENLYIIAENEVQKRIEIDFNMCVK